MPPTEAESHKLKSPGLIFRTTEASSQSRSSFLPPSSLSPLPKLSTLAPSQRTNILLPIQAQSKCKLDCFSTTLRTTSNLVGGKHEPAVTDPEP